MHSSISYGCFPNTIPEFSNCNRYHVASWYLKSVWSCSVTQSRPTLFDHMECSLPGSSVHNILQARIWEWAAISSSRASSPPRDRTHVSFIVGKFFTAELPCDIQSSKYYYLEHFRKYFPSPGINCWADESKRHTESCTTSARASIQSLSCVRLFATPWTAAHQASLSITNSQSPLKLMSIEWVMSSNHPILCHPLRLLPSISKHRTQMLSLWFYDGFLGKTLPHPEDNCW